MDDYTHKKALLVIAPFAPFSIKEEKIISSDKDTITPELTRIDAVNIHTCSARGE